MKIAWMLPALLTAALPLSALAGKNAAAEKKPSSAAAEHSESQAQKLAEKYKVPLSEVTGLRDKGMGWGEINAALAIARKSGQPLSDVVKLRESGMGWGEIAQKYGFKLGDAVGGGRDKDHDRGRDRGGDRNRDRDRGAGRDSGPGRGADFGRGHGRGR